MHIVILGNGISGITAARFIRKMSDHTITVISKETDYFFSRTALMYIYMGHMRFKDTQPYAPWFWQKNRIHLIRGEVTEIDFTAKVLRLNPSFKVQTVHSKPPATIKYDKLILAMGSSPNKFGWPGQDLDRVQGMYSYQDLQNMENNSDSIKRAVIVGGGLIGIEMAEMFHSRHIPCTFLVRENSYWDMVLPKEESEMINRHIREHGIDLRLSTELKEIIGNEDEKAVGVVTNTGEKIPCQFVGLTAGVHPNVHWLKGTGLEIEKGILVDAFLESNIKDVYAVGDCAQKRDPKPGRRAIEAVWYTGRMMGETAAYNICGKPVKYDPGIWFNSAKFFDIEYQVYGTVLTQPPDEHVSIYWEHPDGKKSIRIVFDRKEKFVIGFQLMGIRFRHEVCEKWILTQSKIQQVLMDLDLAFFDPELFTSYARRIIDKYNLESNSDIKLNHVKNYNKIFSFLK